MSGKNNNSKLYKTIREILSSSDRIILTTHYTPDGDGIGCEAALYWYLKSQGKHVRVVNQDSVPVKYQFLDEGFFEVYQEGGYEEFRDYDLMVVLDCNSPARIGKTSEILENLPVKSYFIDHHPYEGTPLETQLIDINASSVGEILTGFLLWEEKLSDIKVANALYVSLMTDTSCFANRGTTSRAHIAASALISVGIDVSTLYESVYCSCRVEQMKLLGKGIESLRTFSKGRIAVITLPYEEFEQRQVKVSETDFFVDLLKWVDTAKIVVHFRVLHNGKSSASIRSKDNIDISTVAKLYGGGGHRCASGITSSLPFEELQEKVIKSLSECFED